jgi:CrcB protein
LVQIFWIGLGGFVGAILRFMVSGSVQWIAKGVELPSGTLLVNLIGSFAFGFLSVLGDRSEILTMDARAFIFVGGLGAFTTFSTFANDSFSLFQDGSNIWGLVNIAIHIILGLTAIWLGRILGQQVFN